MHKIYRALLFQSCQSQSTYQFLVEVKQVQRKLDECRRFRESCQINHSNQKLCICQEIADLSIGLALRPYPAASAIYDGIGTLTTTNPFILAYKTLSFADSISRIA